MLFKSNKIYYPGGDIYRLSQLILSQEHVLIGGTTRSGMSVLLNTTICDAMRIGGLFVFIDLKRVELSIYKDTPFCVDYCNNIYNVETSIDIVINEMERRFNDMDRQHIRKSQEASLYLVIDEYVDIKYSKDVNVSHIESKIMRIVSKGAAANVHVILCTQHCTNKTLTTNIKALFTTKIGLRVVSAQESRNILGVNGCEGLPMYGQCYVLSPNYRDIQKWQINMLNDEEIANRIKEFKEYNLKMKETERKKGFLFRWL